MDGTLIKVIGIRGCDCLAVDSMLSDSMVARDRIGVELICVDTEVDVLKRRSAHRVIRLGRDAWGSAGTPEEGRRAAEAVAQDIRTAIKGAHMVFIPVVQGGGYATGVASVIACLAREMGLLAIVGAVTKPAEGDDERGLSDNDANLAALERDADALILMRYAKLMEVLGDGAMPDAALVHACAILKSLVRDIALAVNVPGYVGVDFEDVRTVLGLPGKAVIGIALASGRDRAHVAFQKAVASPLLDGVDLGSTQAVLVLISGAQENFRLSEAIVVMDAARACCGPEAHVIFCTAHDNTLGDAMRVTVLVAGLSSSDERRCADPSSRE